MKYLLYLKTVLFLTLSSLGSNLKSYAYDFSDDKFNFTITSIENLTCELSSANLSGWDTVITIPEKVTYSGVTLTVTSIGKEAFLDKRSIRSVVFPSTIITIGDKAFSNTSIQSITLPESLKKIGVNAFAQCLSLKKIAIPSSVTNIGSYAFSNCESLIDIKFLDNSELKEICSYAFYNCNALQKINIPNSVIYLRSNAFSECKSLVEVNFGDQSNLKYIDDNVFKSCGKLKEIILPPSTLYIGKMCFSGCNNLSHIELGNNIFIISIGAFKDCGVIKMNLPQSLKYLGANAFSGCEQLKELVIEDATDPITVGDYTLNYDGNGVNNWNPYRCEEREIPEFGFGVLDRFYIGRKISYRGCKNHSTFKSLLGNGYKELGIAVTDLSGLSDSFDNLQTIKIYTDEPPICPEFSFLQYLTINLFIPKGCLDIYKQNDGWKKFQHIQEFEVSGVEEIAINSVHRTEKCKYSLNGYKVNNDYKGIVILVYSDGSTEKKLVK